MNPQRNLAIGFIHGWIFARVATLRHRVAHVRLRRRRGTPRILALDSVGADPDWMTDADHPAAPNPVRAVDVAVLVGWLAIFEGELIVGRIPPQLTDRLRSRFERHGLLRPGGTEREFRQALNDLNHRLRYVLGEYSEPPETDAAAES